MFQPIYNQSLTLAMIPAPDAGYTEIERFALTIDGYREAGGGARAAEIAEACRNEYTASQTFTQPLTALRISLFLEQRRFRHYGAQPTGQELAYIRALLQAIRARVAANQRA